MSAPERLLTDLNPVCRIPLRIESDDCKLNITGRFPILDSKGLLPGLAR